MRTLSQKLHNFNTNNNDNINNNNIFDLKNEKRLLKNFQKIIIYIHFLIVR